MKGRSRLPWPCCMCASRALLHVCGVPPNRSWPVRGPDPTVYRQCVVSAQHWALHESSHLHSILYARTTLTLEVRFPILRLGHPASLQEPSHPAIGLVFVVSRVGLALGIPR